MENNHVLNVEISAPDENPTAYQFHRIRDEFGNVKIITTISKEEMYAFELEQRLLEWGRWLVKSYTVGIGYPSRSTLIAALEGSRGTAPIYPPDNPYAEEVNKAFFKLYDRYKSDATVLLFEYTEPGKQIAKAKKFGLPLHQYRSCLRVAKKFIEGNITR